ncbi:hypothetical protein [Micromonospora sp. NPDC049891]|uniref:hypothetical protein n=1 Tax=Micromonospora sp. NPDC049891 TaxID=3155655 RepID=UPI0033E7C0CE
MTLPLLPGHPPAYCRGCHRPIPVGPVIDGYGIECARQRGLTPPTSPRMPDILPQDGPSLFDWQECPPENDKETPARGAPQ